MDTNSLYDALQRTSSGSEEPAAKPKAPTKERKPLYVNEATTTFVQAKGPIARDLVQLSESHVQKGQKVTGTVSKVAPDKADPDDEEYGVTDVKAVESAEPHHVVMARHKKEKEKLVQQIKDLRAKNDATQARLAKMKAKPKSEDAREESVTEQKKSKGHLMFKDGYEWFEYKGDVFRAPIGNAFDIDAGVRHGRFELKKSQWDQRKKRGDYPFKDLGEDVDTKYVLKRKAQIRQQKKDAIARDKADRAAKKQTGFLKDLGVKEATLLEPGFVKTPDDEKKWDRAKEIAKKQDADEPYALANHVYQNMKKGESMKEKSLKDLEKELDQHRKMRPRDDQGRATDQVGSDWQNKEYYLMTQISKAKQKKTEASSMDERSRIFFDGNFIHELATSGKTIVIPRKNRPLRISVKKEGNKYVARLYSQGETGSTTQVFDSSSPVQLAGSLNRHLDLSEASLSRSNPATYTDGPWGPDGWLGKAKRQFEAALKRENPATYNDFDKDTSPGWLREFKGQLGESLKEAQFKAPVGKPAKLLGGPHKGQTVKITGQKGSDPIKVTYKTGDGEDGEILPTWLDIQESKTISSLRSILSERKAASIDGQSIDPFTARRILEVYDSVSVGLQEQFEARPVSQMASMAFDLSEASSPPTGVKNLVQKAKEAAKRGDWDSAEGHMINCRNLLSQLNLNKGKIKHAVEGAIDMAKRKNSVWFDDRADDVWKAVQGNL